MARRGDADARALVDQVDDELRALPRLPRAGRPLDEEVPRAEDADEPLHLPEVTRLDRPRVRRARAGACGCLPWWPWASYFRPYDLRHTCATLLINEGRPASEVAEYLGHADSGFTARVYTHVFQDAARRRRVPVSRRDSCELVRELFGAELSTGAVEAIVSRAGEALALPYEKLLGHIRCAPAVNVDETGWRLRGSKRTLWAALTPQAAVFRIAPDRHEREAKALLGDDFQGIASSDRWWAYDYLEPERRQLCWAHLVRDFTAHSEGLGAQKEFGQAGLAIAGRVFEAWDEYRESGDRARLLERISPAKDELRALLERAARKSTKTKRHRLFARNLLTRWPALWTFTLLDGVEPTNNHAERGLRGAVIYRKLSLGSQSHHGERTIERLLSASVTCRLQGRSLFAYLTDVLSARIRGDPIPLLA